MTSPILGILMVNNRVLDLVNSIWCVWLSILKKKHWIYNKEVQIVKIFLISSIKNQLLNDIVLTRWSRLFKINTIENQLLNRIFYLCYLVHNCPRHLKWYYFYIYQHLFVMNVFQEIDLKKVFFWLIAFFFWSIKIMSMVNI